MTFQRRSAGKTARFFSVATRCVGLCLLAGAAQAANPSDTQLTLREAISATLEANPGLSVYRFREEALAGVRTTAGLRPPLQVNGGVEDTLGTGALRGLDSSEFTLSLSQVIELGEQRDARLGVAGQRADLLSAEQRVTELDLLAEVTRRFIATAVAQELLVVQQRATALAQQTLDAVQPLVEAGQTPASEQARASAALERARLAEGNARVTLEAARVNLASMWASQIPQFEGVSAELLTTGGSGDLTNLLLGVESNPDLLLFASEERLLEAQVREAMSERRGTLQWTAGIRHLRAAGDTGFVVGLSMPLGSRERAAGAIATAEANFREVAARRDIALNLMRAQLYSLHLQLTQAILEVNTLQDSVLPPLNSALEQTREAYLGGRYSYLELTTAQRETLDAELALITAAADAHLLRAEIERLSGAALNPDSEETNP
jgi:cobalt-zinc-cadmium efflux system outer membrane protein